MNNTSTQTTYAISIFADNIWAGDGKYNDRSTDTKSAGYISDCDAVLGGSQEKAEEVYDAIEGEITDMDAPDDGEIENDGVIYSWQLTKEEE